MKLLIYLTIGIICMLVWSCATTISPVSPEPKGNTQSDYIFVGRVIQQGVSNVSFVKNDKDIFLVEVEKVLKSSAGHENYERGEITVKANSDVKLEMNKRFIIYANTWLFGESLAVIANQVENDLTKIEAIDNQIRQNESLTQDIVLREKLASARAVIVGKVVEISEPDVPRQTRITEHTPMWQVAQLDIETVLKGDDVRQFVFSNSQDVLWYKSPKFRSGDRGIFILQPSEEGQLSGYLQLVDPIDFQNIDQLERVTKLLN